MKKISRANSKSEEKSSGVGQTRPVEYAFSTKDAGGESAKVLPKHTVRPNGGPLDEWRRNVTEKILRAEERAALGPPPALAATALPLCRLGVLDEN